MYCHYIKWRISLWKVHNSHYEDIRTRRFKENLILRFLGTHILNERFFLDIFWRVSRNKVWLNWINWIQWMLFRKTVTKILSEFFLSERLYMDVILFCYFYLKKNIRKRWLIWRLYLLVWCLKEGAITVVEAENWPFLLSNSFSNI